MNKQSMQETIQTINQIQVVECIEHDDGTATVTFEITEETKEVLIQYALKTLLEKLALENKSYNAIDNQ